ncbi:restriction endonuclease subunit S [Paenarthrobacter nicotinovorans]|uniref:restriction endonuclease subunit S n=1 Tax=Paenarthrobacter nicotinovorans TaxID=29320 RepID=UPI00382CAAD4
MKFASLGDVATIDRQSISPEGIHDGTMYVGLENIVSGGELTSIGPVSNGDLASSKFIFNHNHILYGKLRPYLAKIAVPGFEGVCSTDILPIRVGPDMDKMFVAHYLRQSHIVKQVNGLASGANLPRVSPTSLATIRIPVPPLTEQKRIAAILDKADDLRAKRRQAIAHLDALTQSIFHSMFEKTQHQTSSIELADAVAPGTVVTYGIVQAGEEFPGGIPYIRTGDLSGGRIASEKLRRTDPVIASKFERSRVSADDIVMSIRATVGTVAQVPPALDGANLTQGTARIAPGPDMTSSYLLEYLRAEPTQRWIQRNVKGATFKEITLERLRRLPVSVPPLELQQTFANRIAAVERLKETHRKHLAELDALFASLQSRAFKGEL